MVTPRARSLPDLMNSIDDGMLSNMTCTCPPIRSGKTGPAPLYGTCVILMPVINMNNSPDRCTDVPLPEEARMTLPGFAFA